MDNESFNNSKKDPACKMTFKRFLTADDKHFRYKRIFKVELKNTVR